MTTYAALPARGSIRPTWWAVLARGVPAAAVIAAVSQYLVESLIPGYCDENIEPGTDAAHGCDLLSGGGYMAIRLVPAAIVIAFMLIARWRGRLGWLYAGFALTLVMLIVLASSTPSEYPV